MWNQKRHPVRAVNNNNNKYHSAILHKSNVGNMVNGC